MEDEAIDMFMTSAPRLLPAISRNFAGGGEPSKKRVIRRAAFGG